MESDRKNSDRIYRVPVIVDDGAILPANAKPEDFAIWYIGGKLRKVYLVPASKEVYDTVVNPDETEKKQKQRAMQNAETKGMQYAPPLSLDSLIDEFNFDPVDPSDQIEIITLINLVRDAMKLLRKKNPLFAEILDLYSRDYTQREIAKKLNYSRGSIRNYLPQALKMLSELIEL